MSRIEDAAGPFIVWENLGCEGWHPKSFATIEEAVTGQKYATEYVITRRVSFRVVEDHFSR